MIAHTHTHTHTHTRTKVYAHVSHSLPNIVSRAVRGEVSPPLSHFQAPILLFLLPQELRLTFDLLLVYKSTWVFTPIPGYNSYFVTIWLDSDVLNYKWQAAPLRLYFKLNIHIILSSCHGNAEGTWFHIQIYWQCYIYMAVECLSNSVGKSILQEEPDRPFVFSPPTSLTRDFFHSLSNSQSSLSIILEKVVKYALINSVLL